ncbi:MAG: serine/threonine-protein kinase [Myxococcota bacterium]
MSDVDPLVGATLASQFRIVRRLGQGGMGAVYAAVQVDMDRPVVVKVMHAEVAGNEKAVERFKREAKAVAALNHPNIVSVYAFGQTDDGELFLAMELIDGPDVAHVIMDGGALGERRALGITEQALAALVEAHSHGIVHRDLKPENLMLSRRHGQDDWVKVLDFGIAKVMDQDPDRPALTREGAVFGTPRYMAPEQVRGERVDARTDLYALGLVLYEMITGRHPFGQRAPLDYMIAHVSEPTPPPDGVTAATAALLERALAKEPDERFASAREMKDAVARALVAVDTADGAAAHAPAAAIAAGAGRSAGRAAEPRRAVWPWLALGAAAVAGIVIAVLVLGGKPRGPVAEPDAGGATELAQAHGDEDASDEVEPEPDPPTEAEADSEGEPEPDAIAAAVEDAIAEELLAEGAPIDGFPVPAGTTIAREDGLVVVIETPLEQRALLAFFKAKLDQRGWKWSKFPNGIQILDSDSPFSSILLSRYGSTLQVSLGRAGSGGSP